jgi:ribosomal protein S18 acetylase RimI-like enzyme
MIGAGVEHDHEVAILNGFFVLPSVRGRGIGKRLLDAMAEHLKQFPDLKSIELTVSEDQAAAVQFYQASGFKVTERLDGTMGDGAVHEQLLMRKPLAEA